jgi:photosystem II stability/assembly factor-like uncharacterized protein
MNIINIFSFKAKLVLILLLSVFFNQNTFTQWILQSPIPTGIQLNGAGFTSPSHVFICGDNRTLMETTNGGANWVDRALVNSETDPYYNVYFADSEHGYLVGNNIGNDSWRTTDGGITWVLMTTVPGGSWYHIDFVSPTVGFIGANGACAFTSDGGINWILRSGYPTCPIMFGMDFLNAQTGLVCGLGQSADGIFKTTDGGSTWTIKLSLITNDVIWMNQNIALATVGTSIYQSVNAGDSWTEIFSGISTGLLDIERVDANTVVGVSGKGDIWRSVNGGASWTMVLDGLGDLPANWAVSFYDSMHGWVVGQSGFILGTSDGGATWTMINNGIGIQIYDLEMYSSNFGLAACNNGYVLRTTSGGVRWETQKLGVTGQIFGRDESLHAVTIVDTGFAVAAGPGGTVFKTNNGGLSWLSIGYPVLPGNFWIEDVKFVNHSEGWLVGLDEDPGHDKTVYHTTDGGATWVQAMNQSSYMFSVDFVDPQHGWIATAGSLYFHTTNSGASWQQNGLPQYFTGPTVSKMRFTDQNNGWVVGWDGFVARTTDGGNQWTIVDVGTTQDHFFGLSVVSPSEVWMTGREDLSFDGVVYHTTNAGSSWSREVVTNYPPDVPYSISARPSGDVWFGGYGGRIFKKNGVNGVINNQEIPLSFSLYQNYPNPFNPATLIKYSISKVSNVKLIIYDILGREVKRLVNNEIKSAGNYIVEFNGQNYTSGVYIYRIEAEQQDGKKFVESKKMVLIK